MVLCFFADLRIDFTPLIVEIIWVKNVRAIVLNEIIKKYIS